MKNIIKSLEIRKSFMRKFKIKFFIMVTVEKKSIQENDSFVEYFLNFWGEIQVWLDYLLIFDKWVELLEKLLGLILWWSGDLLYFIFI